MKPLTFWLSLVVVLTGGIAGPVAAQAGATVSDLEYEGWRQYSVQCARCHGQDALPNPVAANLLVSMAPGGPAADKETFTKIVINGAEARGMPAFADVITPAQVDAAYAYLKGRAAKKIPAGRPKEPAGPAKEKAGT
jgi:mono/diheme cytochrome c family protein